MVLERILRVLALATATVAAAQDPQVGASPTPTPTPPVLIDGESPSPTPVSDVKAIDTSNSAVSPTASLAPSASPSPTPVSYEDPPLGPEELRIRANRQEGGQGKLHYEGFVDLRFGQLRVQADSLNMFEETKPDGTTGQRIEAVGNVVFMSGQERIAGESLRLDLDTGKGIFTKASGYLQPDVLFEADSIERVDADTYRLKGARFTACTQPNPRWQFRARSATVDVDKWIKATLVDFRIKSVPTPLLIPYMQFPINPDNRATGILIPTYGSSTQKGREIGLGFFWAMGRSADQTFNYDWYTTYGIGIGHELRYIRNSASRGTFSTHLTRRKEVNKFEYNLDWSASQALPYRFRALLSANFYSDIVSQQELQDSFDYASTRTRRGEVGLQGSIKGTYIKLAADTNDVFYFDDSVQRRRHVPQLKISASPKKIGKTGVAFAYEATAERLAQGDAATDAELTLQEYSRFDAAPQLTRTFSVPFLQVTPKALVRYTRYSTSVDDNGELLGPALDRRFFEGNVEVRGPKLFKIFSLPGNVYSDKFKHTFEPELLYTYRSKTDAFLNLPSFDYGDAYPGTNQLLYGLTNRIYAKRPGANGKLVTHEFLNWRVSQTYYFDIGQNAGEFDPAYISPITATGPGGAASHKSPIVSNLNVRPTLSSSINFNVEYNPNFRQISNLTLGGRINTPRAAVQASWNKNVILSETADERVPSFSTVRGGGKIVLWPERLTVEGSLTYNVLTKLLYQSSAKVRYGIQCCGFAVEKITYNSSFRTDSKLTFQIELAGIGSAGNFMGSNPANQNNGGRK